VPVTSQNHARTVSVHTLQSPRGPLLCVDPVLAWIRGYRDRPLPHPRSELALHPQTVPPPTRFHGVLGNQVAASPTPMGASDLTAFPPARERPEGSSLAGGSTTGLHSRGAAFDSRFGGTAEPARGHGPPTTRARLPLWPFSRPRRQRTLVRTRDRFDWVTLKSRRISTSPTSRRRLEHESVPQSAEAPDDSHASTSRHVTCAWRLPARART
jgi:hypothetical protein